MKGNSFGRLFRVTTWGESHGPAMGAVIDGCPAGISLQSSDFMSDIAMRQGGQASFSTPRKETDFIEIESGVFEGLTTGAPIALRIANNNTRAQDYEAYRDIPRPGHADFTTHLKHGHRDHRGGGRSSARETVARVAAAVVAKKILAVRGIRVLAFVRRIGALEIPERELPFHSATAADILEKHWARVEQLRGGNALALPTENFAEFISLAERTKLEGNSLGGSIECWVRGLPAGLGEPIFDKLNALLGHALLSLPAATGVEIGGGIAMSLRQGSEIRDPIVPGDAGPRVGGNRHGGLLGGLTTGEPLWMRVHFHAPTSIPREIPSVQLSTGESRAVLVEGRHDSVPLPRAVPMVEAMAALVLADSVTCLS